MKIDKPGRYGQRDGRLAKVFVLEDTLHRPVVGIRGGGFLCRWCLDGLCNDGCHQYHDIIEYIGPLQDGDDGFRGDLAEKGGDA